MDRRDTIPPSNYYTPRGISATGTGTSQSLLHGSSSGFHSLPNTSLPYQSNFGSTLQAEPSTAISPHGINVGAPTVVPSAPVVEPMVKRKRGRPRKYGPDGAVSLALSSASISNPGSSVSTQKRGRGRPPGSGRKQQLASSGDWLSGSAGMGFTPHVITVAVGEDIATKIMAFSQQGPRALCVLSANGAVSAVTLRQPSSSGGTVTYEGRFEILCLSGSYLLTESGDSRNKTGGLSISLASPDGRVIGGGVGGILIAATPVQVIVGSFSWGSSKSKNKKAAAPQAARDSDTFTVPNVPNVLTAPQSRNLTPTVPVGIWPDSQAADLEDVHVDIDLMRG